MSVTDSEQRRAAIPVTVVTGAIGVGKSRLIEKVWCADQDIVYISSRMAIEYGLPTAGTLEAFETLEHLCLCCSPREELDELLEHLQGQSCPRIIIETTGLCDPAFLRSFLALHSSFRVDSVICLVDADTFGEIDAITATGLRSIEYEQVAVASLVIVNRPLALLDSIPSLVATRSIKVMDSFDSKTVQDLLLRGTGWNAQQILATDAHYFDDATPYRRHQERYTWATLVNIQSLSSSQAESVIEWISTSVSWIRLKALIYVDNGHKIVLDGCRGVVHRIEGGEWRVEEEIPSNKFAFVGYQEYLSESSELVMHLETACGVVMQPTVLYSAPAPQVDTFWQRSFIFAILIILALSSWPSGETRLWLAGAVLIYFILGAIRHSRRISESH